MSPRAALTRRATTPGGDGKRTAAAYGPGMDAANRERMLAAIDRYNRGDYFTAQGDLEALFNELPEDDRALVRGLMTLATAMHLLFQRRGGRGVHNLLRQVMVGLDQLGPECDGIATGELFDAVEAYLQELESRKKPGAGFFDRWLAPKIRYS